MSENLIVKTHYRTLKAMYDTQRRSYEKLPDLSGKKKNHKQNFQILIVEIYKFINNICPSFTWDYFKQKNNPHNLRNTQIPELGKYRTKIYRLHTAPFIGGFCGINYQIILKKQNSLYIPKIKFGNGQGGHVLVASALKSIPFKKCTYLKKNLL